MSNKISVKAQSPYFDDFDPAKDYVQVLFRPGYPVQARELTTLQSFLQEQISRVGEYLFQEGSPVKSAELTYADDVFEVVLTADGNTVYPSTGAATSSVLSAISDFENQIITNASGTVKAVVIPSPTGTDRTKFVGNIYIKYLTTERFDSNGGYIYANTSDNPKRTQVAYQTFSQTTPACVVSSSGGIFFAEGTLVEAMNQSIVISNISHKPSCDVGFFLDEAIVTQDEDITLYDNARGSTNEGAPGAHRLKYTLTLGYRNIGDAPSTNFYRVATYIDGVKQEQAKYYSEEIERILEILARRTNDESGDYTVTPFNKTVSDGDSDADFIVKVSPGKAYVKGWEISKTSPTLVSLVRGFDNTKLNKNYKIPVPGTTSLEINSVTGNLPGSTDGSALNANRRLLLKDSSNNTIGIARAWAIKDEVYRGVLKTKLYIYDIKMFTVITTADTAFTSGVGTGNDLVSNKTRGYAFDEEGTAGIPNGLAIISATGKFRAGQVIESKVKGLSSTITQATSFTISDIATITDTTGASFTANVVANSIDDQGASLIVETGKHIKTLKDGSTNVMDLDFNVLENTGSTASNINTANGFYDSVRIDDQADISKTLRYSYIKISNDSDRGAANYGWMARDKEVSLFYPDVHRIYKISQSKDDTFDNGAFTTINITTPGVIPVGSVLTGQLSGAKAVVALQNSINKGQTSLSTSSTHHLVRTGTGSASKVQVAFTKGLGFTANEKLNVTVPSTATAYTYDVTVTSTTEEVGSDITGSFLFDNGQRAEYYDIGRLVRKDNIEAPDKDIIVFFSYFEADATSNHYYSADSYSNENFISVDPRYYGDVQEIKPKQDDTGVDLRNVLDFRLRVQTNTSIGVSPFNFNNRNFVDQDRIVPDTTFTTDFYEYLGRTDLISLQKNGNFKIISGVPSTNPKQPTVSQDGMPVFFVSIPPAVRYPEAEIAIKTVENRRYTMRDIGEIDRKVNMLQEQVALSLLEGQALHDDVDGRTKSGFVVDDFSLAKDNPQSSADEKHPEYKATIDIVARELIPAQTPGVPVEMSISSQLRISTFFSNYLLRSFTEEAFSTQLNATTSQKINPFATWTFDGDLKITPEEDNWVIRTDTYFTSLYGELKPFEGNAAGFNDFMRVNTSSPGGRSTTTVEWIGTPTTTVDRSAPHTVPDPAWGGVLRQAITTRQVGAARTTTRVKFDEPRPTGEVVSTLTDRRVVENLKDYFMKSIEISYTASNLKPNTAHKLLFGGQVISTGLVTSEDGFISGKFTIPAQTFKAGKENVELKDEKTNGTESVGVSTFKAIGYAESYDTVATTVTETVNKSVGTQSQTVNRTFVDPIAQMFTLPLIGENLEKQTSILTSVDLWFSFVDTRKTMNKVKVEIRETVNGYPGGASTIIAESSYQSIDAGKQTTIINDATAVNFKFTKPVVLRGATEYALVVKTPSDTMSVWVSQMGENLIDGSGIHTSQPNVGGYYGSFFVSQNASTWNADQNKDLTYRLKRAKFDTTTKSSITLINTNSDSNYHKADIGAYNQGLAMETFLNSYYVRVFHPNHGLNHNGAQVTISGVEAGTYNGIPDSDLNGLHTIYKQTLDTYMIKVPVRANLSGRINTGTWTTFATQNIVYDSLTTNFMTVKDENDTIDVVLDTTTTSPINLSVANNQIANNSTITPTAADSIDYEADTIIEFEDPKIIRSTTNSTGNDLTMTVTLGSGTEYTSPIIKSNSNLNPIVFRNLTGNFVIDSDLEGLTTKSVTDSDDDDTLLEYASYVQAVQSETEHAAYVTNEIQLEIPADGFTVLFDADMAPTSYVMLAYKIREPGDSTPFEELEWQDFPYAQQITEDNYGAFSTKSDYKQYRLRAETNFEFTSYKLRIRMGTENEAYIPKITDLRIIADI